MLVQPATAGQPPRAQNCMRDIRLLVRATDTQPRAMYCYVRDRTARASYSQLVENQWSTLPRMQCKYVALHDAALFRRQRAQRRWNAVKRLSVRVNTAAAAFREVYAHVLLCSISLAGEVAAQKYMKARPRDSAGIGAHTQPLQTATQLCLGPRRRARTQSSLTPYRRSFGIPSSQSP